MAHVKGFCIRNIPAYYTNVYAYCILIVEKYTEVRIFFGDVDITLIDYNNYIEIAWYRLLT